MGRFQSLGYCRRVDIDAQRQGIDKHAQRTVGTVAGLHTAQQYRAEHHFFTGRDIAQHPRPGQVHQARDADACLSSLSPQTQAQLGGQGHAGLFEVTAAVLHILHTEWQGRLVDVAEHLAEERFVLRITPPQASLGDIVAIRHRLSQRIALTEQVRLNFMQDHGQGGGVADQVMGQQHRQPAVVDRVMAIDNAHQWRVTHIKAVMPRVEALV
ncbi:hypothetical protein IBA8402_33040 [Pseudomonas syringae]